jgi:hypothetical protein
MPHRSNIGHPVEARRRECRCLSVANSARTSGRHGGWFIIEVDSDARKLRHSLRQMRGLWKELEPGTARRVRTLLTQAVSRATDPQREANGPIRVRLQLRETAVRMEVTGPGLHAQPDGSTVDDPSFPSWIIEDLAERWGRGPGSETLWFEIDRAPDDPQGGAVPPPEDGDEQNPAKYGNPPISLSLARQYRYGVGHSRPPAHATGTIDQL